MANTRSYANPNHFYENGVFMKDLYERAVENYERQAELETDELLDRELEKEISHLEQMEMEGSNNG